MTPSCMHVRLCCMTKAVSHGSRGTQVTLLMWQWGPLMVLRYAKWLGFSCFRNWKKEITTADIGLYRDDGLAIINKCSDRKADQVRKQITKIFNSVDLKITVETNLKSLNFLDVNLNLETKVHKPYRKPNDCPMYVHADSNHPPKHNKKHPCCHREKNLDALIQRWCVQRSVWLIQWCAQVVWIQGDNEIH